MFNVKNLWSERSKKTMKEISRYIRYIFNGHLMVVMIFLIGSLAYYYQQWLKTLDEQFPAAIIMAVVLSVFMTYSPIHTFLSDADRVFLLPVEKRLTNYFWKSGIVSFLLQGYILLMVLAALMPMYVKASGATYKNFFLFLFILLLIKIWNLALKWRIQYFVEKSVHSTDSFVRFCLNAVYMYLLFVAANKLLLIILTIVMVGIFYFFYLQSLKKGLKWEELILMEQNRMTTFYRIANLFTDVPKLKDVIKRRKWLDWIASKIQYHEENFENYLVTRTFLRSGDYFGLVIRLTVIGSLIIYYWNFIYGQFIFLILFLYLTGFQLLPLKNHHQNVLWINLYPKAKSPTAYRKVILRVLFIQAIIFGMIFIIKGQWILSILGIAVGLVFAFLFMRYYSLKKV